MVSHGLDLFQKQYLVVLVLGFGNTTERKIFYIILAFSCAAQGFCRTESVWLVTMAAAT